MSIRVLDLYPDPRPIFEFGTSPLDKKYANSSNYAKVGQGHQSLIIGDEYIAGSIPPKNTVNALILLNQQWVLTLLQDHMFLLVILI